MQLRQMYLLISRRHRRQERRAHSWGGSVTRYGLGVGAAFSLLLAVAVLVTGVVYANLVSGLPPLAQIPAMLDAENGMMLQPTRIYDRNGTTLLFTLENTGIARRSLPIDPRKPEFISPYLVQVTTALVEPGFWTSPGISLRHLTSDEPQTIAEQLVSTLLLAQEPPGIKRTFYMRLLAAQLVAQYGRSQVLEWYLNSTYYGHLAYGADNAARLYQGVPASQLDLKGAALLAAMAETPALNPIDAPAAARQRMGEVLDRLLTLGVINAQEHEQASSEGIEFRDASGDALQPADAFASLVLEQLEEKFGKARVEMGGLHVTTTLDSELQAQLRCATTTQMLRLEEQPIDLALSGEGSCDAARLLPTLPTLDTPLPVALRASAVVLDPESGEVLAFLGDSSVAGESPYPGGHEPGSLLTPFAAVAAFSHGFSPASLVWDIPAWLPDDLKGEGNPDGSFHGPQRLRVVLANDYLVPTAHLLEQLGAVEVWRLAEPLGISGLAESPQPDGLIFSGGRVSLVEIAQAYGVFASGGMKAGERSQNGGSLQPVVVRSVEDVNGRVLQAQPDIETQAVLSPQLAYLVHNVLADETARRPSMGYPNALTLGRPSGAKVGRTADGSQVWTAGYTPQLVAVTWMGLPGEEGNQPLDVRMAAGLWRAVMQYASRDLAPEDWSTPAGVTTLTVCDPSGLLPTPACPVTVSETFLAESVPTTADTLYKVFQVNRETGLLATVFTPLEMVEERTYMVVPPEAQDWAREAGIPQPPTSYDYINLPRPSVTANIARPAPFSYINGEVEVRGTAGGEGFSAYRLQAGQGLNPQSWVQIADGTATVEDGVLGSWDTRAFADGLYALRLTVERSGGQIESAVVQVTVDNTPPQVRVTMPEDGQSLEAGDEVTLQAEASDAVGQKRLRWYIDDALVGEREEAPWALAWSATQGEHTLVVEAEDLAGNVARSERVNFSVQ